MKYSGFTRIEVLVVAAVTGISATVLLPALAETASEARERVKTEAASCQSNLEKLARGIQLYTQDADGHLPRMSSDSKGKGAFGWADALLPYVKEASVYQCPSEPTPANLDPKKSGYSDFWFNRNMSGLAYDRLETPSVTLMLGDGETANARSAMDSMPRGWLDKNGTPGRRHIGGANYAFADGHVKWLPPGATTEHSIFSGGTNTFAVK